MTASRSRASEDSGGRYNRRQELACLPRPTRPRIWCNCASPMRSAFSMTMSVALGTSTPTSMTVVATKSWIPPSLKRRMVESFAAGGIRPWTRPTASSGNAAASAAAVSSAA